MTFNNIGLRIAVTSLFFLAPFAVPGFAATQKLKGHVVAYAPWYHWLKVVSFAQNQEIVVFQLDHPALGQTFVKIVFSSFGQEQLATAPLQDAVPITIKGTRDPECDEASPKIVRELESGKASEGSQSRGIHDMKIDAGIYLVSDRFKADPIPQLHNLECYRAQIREKKTKP